ncbi:GH25 family lysozyme [Ruminococcus sp.]|uniref:GH25 family lysozyme n=1 Tax=Ruminococcus sp. TaxID=41978 RepID=UPI0026027513|nr:GH25 family lysozyme [Ruminococcus sp.]MDD7555733.1 GH25 family lysozyme [Ruminococcus sp.]MDY4964293.1 GH25 family lysozyme [Ruminococcus callidus]
MKKQLWLPAAVLVMLLAGCGAQGAEPADAAPVTEATTAAVSTQAVTACTTQTTTETTATATETSATQTTTTEPVRQKITLKTAGAVEVYDTVLLRDYITEPEIRLENKNSRLDTSKTGTVEQSVRFTYQGQSYTQNIRYQVVDTTPPLLLNGGYNTVIETGKPFDLNKCVGFGDNYDKSPRLTYTGQVDTAVPGKYPITATVTDAAGNKTSWDLTVTVADKLPTYTDTASRLSFSDFAEAYGGKNKRLGIDVSKWQGKINFEAVRDAGCQFVIMRIGHGRNGMEMDEYYRSNMAGAKSAGLDVGVYFYSTANTEKAVRQEARWIAENLKGEKLDFPVVFDWESFSNFQKYGMSIHDLNMLFEAFADELQKQGYSAMLYGSKNYLQNFWYPQKKYPVWLAHYTDQTDYLGDYAIWQMSCRGRIPGIAGDVDLDIQYMDVHLE